MCKNISALGLILFCMAGCTGASNTWPSSSEIEVYENHQGTAYKSTLADPSTASTLYSLAGEDASQLAINTQSGEVQFRQTPDYEQPQDYTQDNAYKATVIATDPISGEQLSTIDINITVKDAEQLSATQLFPLPNSYVEPNENGVVPLILTIEDTKAPMYYPDEWQVFDPDITRFFGYYFSFIESQFDENNLPIFLDPIQYGNSNTNILQSYYAQKFLLRMNAPEYFNYGYSVNPSDRITIAYSNKNDTEIAPLELEWVLKDQLDDTVADYIDSPRQIALSKSAIYLASENTLWRMNREGSQLSQIVNTDNSTIEKLRVLNERVLMVLHEPSSHIWRLIAVGDDGSTVDLYRIDGLAEQMQGIEYDVEVLYVNSGYTVVFLPKKLCSENNNEAIPPVMYLYNSMGLAADPTMLINQDEPLFNCQEGLLTDQNLNVNLEYSSPKLSYNPAENILYYWGRRYSEDNINGFRITGDATAVAVGSQYWFNEAADTMIGFQHFYKNFDSSKSFYINHGGLYVANGNIDAKTRRISSEDYQAQNFTVDAATDLIYSIGIWGNAQIPALGVHHIYSGATSHIPLTIE